jgi:hypothetical protein
MRWYKTFLLFLVAVFGFAHSSSATDTVTVMIVATPAAIQGMGGPQAAELKILTEINNVNQSFVNSGIDGYLKIVRTDVLNLHEDICMYDMLNFILTVRDGELGRLHQMRANYAADIVAVIVNEPSQCGISGAYPMPSQAFMLIHYECLGANYSMARQLGYLLGCGNNESQSGRFNPFSRTAYAYYYDNDEDIIGTSFSTIMGYTDERISANEEDFDMIPYWSSADTINIRYQNKAVGDKIHDNAGQIRSALPSVSKYGMIYGLLRLPADTLAPYNRLDLRTKRELEFSEFDIEQNTDSYIKSKRVRFTKRVIIKRGAKVRIESGDDD